MTAKTDSNTISCPPKAAGRIWLILFQQIMATQEQSRPMPSATARNFIGAAPISVMPVSIKPAGQARMPKRQAAKGSTVTP